MFWKTFRGVRESYEFSIGLKSGYRLSGEAGVPKLVTGQWTPVLRTLPFRELGHPAQKQPTRDQVNESDCVSTEWSHQDFLITTKRLNFFPWYQDKQTKLHNLLYKREENLSIDCPELPTSQT